MTKYICIIASAALLASCEQRTENVVAPGTSPAASPAGNNTTIINPSPAGGGGGTSSSSSSTTTTTASPGTDTDTDANTTTTTTTATATPSGR